MSRKKINKIKNKKKDLLRFALIFVLIISIGIFIYPTPYHYSMYRGQYPLMINWMTGETKIFNGTEWRVIENKIEEK